MAGAVFCDQCSKHFRNGQILDHPLKHDIKPRPGCFLCQVVVYMIKFARGKGYEGSRSYDIKIYRLFNTDSSHGLLSLEHNPPRESSLTANLSITTTKPEYSITERYSKEKRLNNIQSPEFEREISRSVILQSRIPRHTDQQSSFMNVRSRSAKSLDSLHKVRSWLETCCQQHTLCRVNLQGYRVTQKNQFSSPIRLVKVQGTEHVTKLQLITISSNVPKFITLSHRWPKDPTQMFRTSKANLGSHLTSIPFFDLPATFRDAIVFAKAIQVFHIWIDSICIVQDDQEDWKIQSAQMGSIFRMSFCTFAATDARSSEGVDGGLFSDCDSPVSVSLENKYSYSTAYRLHGRNVDIDKKSRAAWRTSKVSLRPNLSSFQTLVELSDWNRRGWIFQEHMLSTRILHFTKEQIFWECAEQVASEYSTSLPSNESTIRLQEALRKFIANSNNSNLTVDTFDHRDEFSKVWMECEKFEVWWRLVEEYSICQLTMEGDKWYAVAGMCALLKDVFRDEIHYGVWHTAVGAGLLWSTRNDTIQGYQPNIAPSWSWLGVKGAVQYQYQDNAYNGYTQKVRPLYQSSFTCQDSSLTPVASSDELINGRTLTLSCPTMVARVSKQRLGDLVFREVSGRYNQDLPAWEFFDKITHGKSQMELTKEYRSQKLPPRTNILLADDGRAIGWVIMDSDYLLDEILITCAAILERTLQSRWTKNQQLLEFVALMPYDATNLKLYRRVGRGRIFEYGILESFTVKQVLII